MLAPLDESWLVACLCAEWCGSCRDYRGVLQDFARRHPGVRSAWIDIEDHSDALGDLDVENFPTLLIARGDDLRFYGTLLPHAATLARTVAAARAGALTPDRPLPPGLLARVQALAAATAI